MTKSTPARRPKDNPKWATRLVAIARWYRRVTGGDLIQAVLLFIGFVATIASLLLTTYYSNQQLRENSMRAWEAHLDSKALEIDKLALSDPTLRCIYDWNIAEIGKECSQSVFETQKNLAGVLAYIDQILFFLEEIAQYSYVYDPK